MDKTVLLLLKLLHLWPVGALSCWLLSLSDQTLVSLTASLLPGLCRGPSLLVCISPPAPGIAFFPRNPGSFGEWSVEAPAGVHLLCQPSGCRARKCIKQG